MVEFTSIIFLFISALSQLLPSIELIELLKLLHFFSNADLLTIAFSFDFIGCSILKVIQTSLHSLSLNSIISLPV